MYDIPKAEAEAALFGQLFCQDAPSWRVHKLSPGLSTLECGLVDENGARAGLQISLQFAVSAKTKIVSFKFTVFRVNLGPPVRLYQIQVNAVARAPKNWHDFAHEHVGDARINGNEEWLTWGFKEALDYFCMRANIQFIPPLVDPEEFHLI